MPIKISSNAKKYIMFDNNGTIVSIKSQHDDSLNFIKVNINEIENIIKGIAPIHEYTVEYDLPTKGYMLKHNKEWEQARTSNSFLYKIESDENPDVTLIQNNVKKRWELKFNNELESNIQEHNVNLTNAISGFSITDKDNPYNLHYILNFLSSNKSNNFYADYPSNFEFDKMPISVYTIKKFGSYSHEVIND